MVPDANYGVIEASITRSISQHNPKLDSFLFNGGTLLALAATIVAATVTWPNDISWLSRVLTGLAAFLIGAERALNFGERWRYHLRLRDGYQSIHDRFALAVQASDAQRDELLVKIIADLEQLRRSDGGIPKGSPTQG
ncbi:hypothetical protein ACGFMK_20420 [Amycolatopsis sp. NPDC049252]|uniref:hypothetical protein n=1 Tax=Amycolatopsis sp. NPDC049252 TaxID=3363933 RepID=UPI00372293D4